VSQVVYSICLPSFGTQNIIFVNIFDPVFMEKALSILGLVSILGLEGNKNTDNASKIVKIFCINLNNLSDSFYICIFILNSTLSLSSDKSIVVYRPF
jgi:hypothetical protein